MIQDDQFWMRYALDQAKLAEQNGEVPVGAVLARENKIIGAGYNRPISNRDPSAHAEIVAMREAASQINNYRLLNSTLYVTLEPCVMCAGAMIHARISRLVFAAKDPRAGAITSIFNILDEQRLNHQVTWAHGILNNEASQLLKDFFQKRR